MPLIWKTSEINRWQRGKDNEDKDKRRESEVAFDTGILYEADQKELTLDNSSLCFHFTLTPFYRLNTSIVPLLKRLIAVESEWVELKGSVLAEVDGSASSAYV